MASKPKGKGKKGKGGKSWLIVLAITAFWAAMNEPEDLTMGAAIVWGLTALSVAFLVMAGLALLGPALVLVIRALARPKPKAAVTEADEA